MATYAFSPHSVDGNDAPPEQASPAVSLSALGRWTGDSPHTFLPEDSYSPSTILRLDEFVQDPGYLAYQEELRCLIFSTAEAQTAAPSRAATPVPAELASALSSLSDPSSAAAAATHASSSRQQQQDVRRQTAAILSQGRRVAYLKNYVGQVAPWLDMFDSGGRAFGVQVPVLARGSPALLYAVLAVSARQMERKEGTQQAATARATAFDSLELYQEAIRRLTPLLQARDDSIIVICTVLCVMEMMSASARDWRRHLEGCAALFDAFGVNGFSGGLLQAVFWCYARMDLCGALISDGTQGTLVPTKKWLAPGTDEAGARELFRQTKSPDMHANLAVYLCSCVCDLIANRTRFVELGEANGYNSEVYLQRWLRLWDDLQAWETDRPAEMLPLEIIETAPFPHILYVHWAAISSSQLYHTACILLLGMTPKTLNLKLGTAGSPISHAKRICGISLTNPHQGCLNNAIQPLWIAARLLSHKSEHALVVKLLRDVETMTGWGTSWRITDLETAWGYKVRKQTYGTGR